MYWPHLSSVKQRLCRKEVAVSDKRTLQRVKRTVFGNLDNQCVQTHTLYILFVVMPRPSKCLASAFILIMWWTWTIGNRLIAPCGVVSFGVFQSFPSTHRQLTRNPPKPVLLGHFPVTKILTQRDCTRKYPCDFHPVFVVRLSTLENLSLRNALSR